MIRAITVDNVDDALTQGLMHLHSAGIKNTSRNGDVMVSPSLFATCYIKPQHRVLMNPKRDANPFLHLFEALWVLGGREDVGFLTMFSKRFTEFSDNGITFHAPYGHRLRKKFGFDQINLACKHLKANPDSRRVVLQIWDANLDLDAKSKDLPCNDLVMCTMNPARTGLDITVCCRSNDAVWGAYGTNAVQFSMLQEYMAGKIGVPVGVYTQLSNNFHVYEWNEYWQWFKQNGGYQDAYHYESKLVVPTPLYERIDDTEITGFDIDMNRMFAIYDRHRAEMDNTTRFLHFADDAVATLFTTKFFGCVVRPMLAALAAHKRGQPMQRDAVFMLLRGDLPQNLDWFEAARIWFHNRDMKKAAS